jgi:putative transposase
MPRKPRFFLPGIPCHVVQRGNNRSACFYCDEDFAFYMSIVDEALQKYQVQLHAYVLMTNHVHLLMTPASPEGIGKVMQSIGRIYVRTLNTRYSRTGTLWEGRYKASLIESDAYLLCCQRYIELNPVRAKSVTHPGDYPWSSYQQYGNGRKIRCLSPHPLFLALAKTPHKRQQKYRELILQGLRETELHSIRRCLQHNYPLGNQGFLTEVESALEQKIGNVAQGRPAKQLNDGPLH